MTWYLLPILLLLLLAVPRILWDWRRSGRVFRAPLPRRFRDRQSQEVAWKQICSDRKLDKADALLRTLCEAFSFNPDQRYHFAPTDRLMDVYRACYPRWMFWRIGDNMEIESLMADLSTQFGVNDKNWYSEITLGEIVELMQSPREHETNSEK